MLLPRSLRALVITTTLLSAVIVATWFQPSSEGLRTRYFVADTGDQAAVTVISHPSTNGIWQAWEGRPPAEFTTEFSGTLVTVLGGTYTLATRSDDGSTVRIDGQLVVDNGGTHGIRRASGTIGLSPGVHRIDITYGQRGGGFDFELFWARGDGTLHPIPAWALRDPASLSASAAFAGVALSIALRLLFVCCLSALLWTAWHFGGSGLLRWWQWFATFTDWPVLRWIVGGSFALNLTALWWGLPGLWAQDELTPDAITAAAARHFSDGWFEKYPPLHYEVLALLTAPLRRWAAWLPPGASFETAVVVGRLVTIGCGVVVVVMAALCATRAFNKRAGLFAAAIVALMPPFVFYAKFANLDVPYLAWFSLSLWFYLALLDRPRPLDYALFAITGVAAIATKDQAYGLYLLAPFAIVVRRWRERARTQESAAWWHAVADRGLWTGATAGAIAFVLFENLWRNPRGFIEHVRLITGPASENYQAFEATASGHLALARLTASLMQTSLGWPLLLVCGAGVIGGVWSRSRRATTIWLLLPVVSYYLGFIDVVLYNYDRFVLPVGLVFALFGGFAIDRVLASEIRPQPARLGVAVVLLYGVLYTGTLDAMMLTDSRYGAERWLAAHAASTDAVAVSGPLEVLPRLDTFALVGVNTPADLERLCPSYYVVNADYARAVPADSPWGQLLASLNQHTVPYHLAYRVRDTAPWRWLPGGHPDLVGARLETSVVSTLRNVNARIEIYERESCITR